MAELNLGLKRFPKSVEMSVTIHQTREFLVRRWIAVRLIKAAAWVLNCGIEVIHA